MLKKITTYLLVLAILLAIPVAFASNDDVSTAYPNEIIAVNLFKELGVIDNTEEYLDKLDEKMTRGEVAACVGGFIKNAGFASSEQIFQDVPPTHKAFREINSLAAMGIVSGVGGGFFEPDRAISYPEVLAMVLKLTGYGELIGVKGGFPNGCYSTVQDLRLFSNPSLYCEPTTRNILDLLYRAVQENLMQVTSTGNYFETKGINKNQTILSNYFDVYIAEGILTSDGVVDIKNTTIPARNKIAVDGIRYLSNKNYSDILGQNVICFYRETDDIENTVVYVAPNKKNKVLEINAKDIYEFDNMTLKYNKGKATGNKIKITNQMDIIYNHTVVTELTSSIMVPDEGSIKFVDNDNDGYYDVVIIQSYMSFVVRSMSEIKDKFVITARENLDLPIVTVMNNGENDTLIFDNNHNKIDCTDIKIGSTASVAAVKENDELVAKEIILCEDTVYGDVIRYETNTDDAKLMVDDVSYDVANTFSTLLKTLGIRTDATFNLDVFGEIVDVVENDMSQLDLALGYIIRGNYNREIDDDLCLKVFTELGKMVVYNVSDKATVNGVLYKGAKAVYDALSYNGAIEPQLVVYKLSENREINFIDTAVDFNGEISSNYYDRLTRVMPMANYYYQREQHSFGGKVVIDEHTKIFVIPDSIEEARDNDFRIAYYSDIQTGAGNDVESYSLNNDRAPADAIIMKSTVSNMPSTSVAMAVTAISTAINSEGDITYALSLMGVNGEEKHAVTDTSVVDNAVSQNANDHSTYKIEVGDIVRIETNKSGDISRIVLIYDYSNDEMKNGMVMSGSYFSASRAIKANVYRVLDKYMYITDEDLSSLSSGSTVEASKIETQMLSKFAVVKYEKTNGKLWFKKGSAADVVPYTTSNSDYSRIVIYTHSANEKILFILDQG